jgi:uncharacterized protein
MASFIFRILLLAFVIWLVRRFVAFFIGGAQKSNRKSASTNGTANYMVKDPVCGMYMDSRLAVRLDNGKEATYFCSEECKNRFLGRSSEEKSASEAKG